MCYENSMFGINGFNKMWDDIKTGETRYLACYSISEDLYKTMESLYNSPVKLNNEFLLRIPKEASE